MRGFFLLVVLFPSCGLLRPIAVAVPVAVPLPHRAVTTLPFLLSI
eukprot:COSAG02_NODE_38185_length_432_cov_0.813814_2_plen_44_part_01